MFIIFSLINTKVKAFKGLRANLLELGVEREEIRAEVFYLGASSVFV